jgi:hypothetical protein
MEYVRRADWYREQAADCRKQAGATITPPDVRAHWLRLAEQYDDLANQALSPRSTDAQ